MARPLVVKQSRVVPGGADEAFDLLPLLPLQKIYRRWYGPIPRIKDVIYHDGEWREVGQTRTMVLSGGSAIAEVVHVDRPRSFGYRLGDMRASWRR